METLYLDNYNKNAFNVVKYNENKFNIKYNDKNFIINPKIAFNNCSLWLDKIPYKIRININTCNDEHIDFEYLINIIFNEINKFIKKDKNITAKLMHPLNASNVLENTKILYITINESSIIKDFETKENLEMNALNGKRFIMYPLIFAPNINIYNSKIYINFILKSAYIKIDENIINADNIEIDYNDAINAFNKHN